MIIDFNNNSSLSTELSFDICIIGGGPAGITLALELDNHGLDICLIESGGLKISRKNQNLNKVKNIGIPYKDQSSQRGRFLGGSSNFWGGNCIPLEPIDFEAIEARGNVDWPISYESMEPYFLKAQELLGLCSTNYGNDLIQKIKIPADERKNKLFDLKAWKFCDFPFRFGEKFYDQLSSSKNISVIINSNMVDLEFSSDCFRAKAAVIKNLKGRSELIKADKFVLASGGVENARILLNLAQNSKNNVLNELDLIGKNFAEHPNATIGYFEGKKAKEIYKAHMIKYIDGEKEIKPGLGINPKAQKEKGILNGIVSIWPVPVQNSAITRAKLLLELFRKKSFGLKFLVNTFLVLPGIVSLLPHVRHRIKGGTTNYPYMKDKFEVRLMTETLSNPLSKIELTNYKDSIGMKVAQLDWNLTNRDKKSFISIAKLAKEYFEQEKDIKLVLEPWIQNEETNWTEFINHDGHYGHHMGTTKMGTSKDNSVVDSNCKIHGLKNVFVSGSSVFPTYGFANPTLTIVALSIKLADHFKQKTIA